MQKPKSARVRQKTCIFFLGSPIFPTNVNDIFIQPYTPNEIHLRWKRLKKLICFLQVLWFLVDWRPTSGKHRLENEHVGNRTICHFWKRWGPENHADPPNNILKILDMGSISFKKHEIGIWEIFAFLKHQTMF